MTKKLPLFASAFVSACAIAAVTAAPAAAGHRPHHHHGHHAHKHHHMHKHDVKQCQKRVVHKLHRMGFVSWDEIEWDDGYWEVDDARRADGSQYDLKLAPHSLKVVHSKKER